MCLFPVVMDDANFTRYYSNQFRYALSDKEIRIVPSFTEIPLASKQKFKQGLVPFGQQFSGLLPYFYKQSNN